MMAVEHCPFADAVTRLARAAGLLPPEAAREAEVEAR